MESRLIIFDVIFVELKLCNVKKSQVTINKVHAQQHKIIGFHFPIF